jgi:hypothetical protein
MILLYGEITIMLHGSVRRKDHCYTFWQNETKRHTLAKRNQKAHSRNSRHLAPHLRHRAL